MIRAASIGLVAAVVAVVVGFALSPLTPTGIARIAEPNPGFAFDAAVIVVGALATLPVVAAVAALPAWNAARAATNVLGTAEPKRPRRASATAAAMGPASLPPSAPARRRTARRTRT